MEFSKINVVYFVGIGGIGMSALARYFKAKGKNVSGYDLTKTELTDKLLSENIKINFNDSIENVDKFSKEDTLVIYTPAIPESNLELNYFKDSGFTIKKRAEVLGIISKDKLSIAVAGTHGKTSVSTMITHLFNKSVLKCDAILGGISNNYNSNLVLSDRPDTYLVLEADEFDRSFLHLNPFFSVITSLDADHLDIYKNKEDLRQTFIQFIKQTQDYGKLIINKKVLVNDHINPMEINDEIESYTYSLTDDADFYAKNLQIKNGEYTFDLMCPNNKRIDNLSLTYPGLINVENAIAACAVAKLSGISDESIRKSMYSFSGVKRRFEYRIKTKEIGIIDDYAHHPVELEASISSIKKLYPKKNILGIFQPHLFSRTKDFAKQFGKSLNLLDELILLDIYPAREKPIEGVTSELIFRHVDITKTLCTKENLIELIKSKDIDVILTLGAGDIGKIVPEIEEALKTKYKIK